MFRHFCSSPDCAIWPSVVDRSEQCGTTLPLHFGIHCAIPLPAPMAGPRFDQVSCRLIFMSLIPPILQQIGVIILLSCQYSVSNHPCKLKWSFIVKLLIQTFSSQHNSPKDRERSDSFIYFLHCHTWHCHCITPPFSPWCTLLKHTESCSNDFQSTFDICSPLQMSTLGHPNLFCKLFHCCQHFSFWSHWYYIDETLVCHKKLATLMPPCRLAGRFGNKEVSIKKYWPILL